MIDVYKRQALGRRGSPQLWLSVAIAVCGLYLLCMQNGFGGVERSDMVLLLCAFIWGTAFVAQSAGSGMGACSFLAGRSWLAVLVLLPTVKVFDRCV